MSPIHFDTANSSIPATDFLAPIQMVLARFGPPPFDTLLSANSNPSSLLHWGEDSWVTLHQIGNSREHDYYWYLTQIFRSLHPQPALNGEPYYSGYIGNKPGGYQSGAAGGTQKDDQYVRSGMYGSFLSGGFAGHIYGAEGIWGADVHPKANPHMWEAFQWNSASQMKHLRTFALSIGRRYQDLIPDAGPGVTQPDADHHGYEGWAYSAHTPERDIILAYFEKACPTSQIRTVRPLSTYRAEWFDPRAGTWIDAGEGWLQSNANGVILLPAFPADLDWGLRLAFAGPAPYVPGS